METDAPQLTSLLKISVTSLHPLYYALMQSSSHDALKSLLRLRSCVHCQPVRPISLTGAIEKGIRHGKRASDGKGEERPEVNRRPRRDRPFDSQKWPRDREAQIESIRVTQPPQDKEDPPTAPRSLPFSQADSEFIYGTFAVKAAIAARRRTLHKLYVYTPDVQKNHWRDEVENEARTAGVEMKKVNGRTWLSTFERTSEGRPHNGFLLEASPLPTQTVVGGLKAIVRTPDSEISSSGRVQTKSHRFPFYLFLDQILDPGNLGAIIRSAYFFGVDGIIIPEHNTAPITAVAVKASAGAAEYLPLLRVRNEVAFIQKSRENGWCFYGAAAVLPGRSSAPKRPSEDDEHGVGEALYQRPTVLVLGSEAEGIRPRIARALDRTISIGTSASHLGVDSLNVSVAASILIRDFVGPHSSGSHSRE